MMNNKSNKIPEMLTEVWKMKDKMYEETKNMSCEELFNYINEKTESAVSSISKAQKAKV